MKSYATRHGFRLLALAAICCCVNAPSSSIASDPAPIRTTLCELQTRPEKFSGRVVEFRASIITNFEMSMLSDDSCPKTDVHVWFGGGLVESGASEYAVIDPSQRRSPSDTTDWQRCPTVTLEQNRQTRAMFRAMRKQEKRQGYGSAIASIVGLFQYIPADKVMVFKAADGRTWETSRFGHQLCCNARLLPVAIHDVVVSPKSAP